MLDCHRRLTQAFGACAKLDASVGASGPHGFAVRKLRRSSVSAFASTASHPAFVTFAIAPLRSRRDEVTIAPIKFPENRIIFSGGD
jgi:hypothetical protein